MKALVAESGSLRAFLVNTRRESVPIPLARRAQVTVVAVTLAREEPARNLLDPPAARVPAPA